MELSSLSLTWFQSFLCSQRCTVTDEYVFTLVFYVVSRDGLLIDFINTSFSTNKKRKKCKTHTIVSFRELLWALDASVTSERNRNLISSFTCQRVEELRFNWKFHKFFIKVPLRSKNTTRTSFWELSKSFNAIWRSCKGDSKINLSIWRWKWGGVTTSSINCRIGFGNSSRLIEWRLLSKGNYRVHLTSCRSWWVLIEGKRKIGQSSGERMAMEKKFSLVILEIFESFCKNSS